MGGIYLAGTSSGYDIWGIDGLVGVVSSGSSAR